MANQIKEVIGVALANIKKINNLGKVNIKSIGGVDFQYFLLWEDGKEFLWEDGSRFVTDD
jgi:hypothetical protein